MPSIVAVEVGRRNGDRGHEGRIFHPFARTRSGLRVCQRLLLAHPERSPQGTPPTTVADSGIGVLTRGKGGGSPASRGTSELTPTGDNPDIRDL
jgi:hypothetical protein